MIVNYTDEDIAKISALGKKYNELIDEQEALIERLRPSDGEDGEPDMETYQKLQDSRPEEPEKPEPISYKGDKAIYDNKELKLYNEQIEEWKKINEIISDQITQLYEEWEEAGSEEWRQARRRNVELMAELSDKRRELYKEFERREFNKLNGNPTKILENAKEQILLLINKLYTSAVEQRDEGAVFSTYYLRVDGNNLYIDPQTILEESKGLLHLHYEFFNNDPKNTEAIDAIVTHAVAESPHISKKGILRGTVNEELSTYNKHGNVSKHSKHNNTGLQSVLTRQASTWITPTDKTSRSLFDSFVYGENAGIKVSKRTSKKPIVAKVSLDVIDDDNIQIRGKDKAFSTYDREVHDAIVTLYVDGQNDHVTPQMIYRAMVGDNDARVTNNQQKAISDSVNKLMYSKLTIDATDQFKAMGYTESRYEGAIRYEGAMLQAEKLIAALNGNVTEAIHILKTPILYSYADKINQIGRMDIKLLNSPVIKTEENIILQGYLSRRILSMKGSPKMTKTIVYETVYEKINIEKGEDGKKRTDSALRKKKSKVRDTIKVILNHWKANGFILGYLENKKGRSYYSVTIAV